MSTEDQPLLDSVSNNVVLNVDVTRSPAGAAAGAAAVFVVHHLDCT